jgi:hypothetical protein
MSKIVRFKTSNDSLVESLEGLLERAKNGEFMNYIFACNTSDGNIATGWCNADIGKMQELSSHLQCDIVYKMVEANMDRLVEYV